MKAVYTMVEEDHGATPTFTVRYRIPGEDHVLCEGMYGWAAKWLVEKLNETGDYPRPHQLHK